ncbi:MAG TPA: right-handed parallel beta-helix repeat-containing protein [Candidatus Tectomicrobia bacterium]|nr:right-handed parallel beta-helix repeat-containing protein [Candidatus Tectomicrobia bacterium]
MADHSGTDAGGGRRSAALALALVAVVLAPVSLTAGEIGPDEDWCRAIDALPPGEELVLRPGEYAGGCSIRRGGLPGAPLVIRAEDPTNPPRLVYQGSTSNVIDVRASHVVIKNLALGHTQRGVDGVRIHGAVDVTVEGCRFTDLGGIAVVANRTSSRDIVVRGNVIERVRATAMYFGCHDGVRCAVTGVVVERNHIDGVDAPEREIGYGLQVKLNSSAVVRDNVILDTKGPAIMVYGATPGGPGSLVEANLVGGSRTSSGIVVAGGPVVVRNNIAVRNAEAGIGLENYHARGLLRDIVIASNTVHGNGEAGIAVPRDGVANVRIVNNAVHAQIRGRALPANAGVLARGNVDCTLLVCFRAPEQLDFSPAPGSPLVGRGAVTAGDAMAARDYFGRERGVPPTVGAVEGSAPAIRPGVKPLR